MMHLCGTDKATMSKHLSRYYTQFYIFLALKKYSCVESNHNQTRTGAAIPKLDELQLVYQQQIQEENATDQGDCLTWSRVDGTSQVENSGWRDAAWGCGRGRRQQLLHTQTWDPATTKTYIWSYHTTMPSVVRYMDQTETKYQQTTMQIVHASRTIYLFLSYHNTSLAYNIKNITHSLILQNYSIGYKSF